MESLLDWLRTLPSRLLDSPPAHYVGNWYRSLTERDQVAVIWLCVFGLLLALLYGVMLPLWQYHEDGRARFDEARETQDWIERQAPQLASLSSARQVLIDGSVDATLSSTGRQFNLAFKRLEPVGDGAANVWLEKVPFNQVVSWLAVLKNDYGLRPRLLEVDRKADGIVDVRLVVEG